MNNKVSLTLNLNVEEGALAKILAMVSDEEQVSNSLLQLVGQSSLSEQSSTTGLGSYDEELEAKLALLA